MHVEAYRESTFGNILDLHSAAVMDKKSYMILKLLMFQLRNTSQKEKIKLLQSLFNINIIHHKIHYILHSLSLNLISNKVNQLAAAA